ncbi:non-ribosomal peptide synthase/polyketide synthase [Halomonas sp. AOP35-4E-18]|uniref:non-ribosomal peptide synthase/polyketide synthase n=1 Tax=Halomonas sp. AOP35-4E-18 TaxID=3457686 RepID=UPI004034B57A
MELDERKIAQRFAELQFDAQRSFLNKLRSSGIDFRELPIVPAIQDEQFPLSYSQRSLWLTWQLDPASPAYNMPGVFHLQGPLDVAAFESSVNDLVVRHEVLRTIYPQNSDGEPLQEVIHGWRVPVLHDDLQHHAELEQEKELQRLIGEFSLRPFTLDVEPPFRMAIYQLDTNHHAVAIVLHHIACDGWSVQLLINELFEFYEARTQQRNAVLPSLPIQFGDYAVWQRSWFEAGEKERQLDHWLQRLGDSHSPIDLPFDHPRGSQATSKVGHCHFQLSREVSHGIHQLAREYGASLYMVMLSLLKLTLHRFSGQSDIRIGSPSANRNKAETHGLIGYLLNVQVLRTLLEPTKGFASLLGAVKETVLDAQDCQDIPFDTLVEALQPERQPSVHPLFQVKCTQQKELEREKTVSGLTVHLKELSGGDAHFDLSFDFTDTTDGIRCVFAYAAALFDETTVKRFAEALQSLAEQVLKTPSTPLALLEIPAPTSVLEGNTTTLTSGSVIELWDRAVEEHSQQLAMQDEPNNAATYASLDAQAQRLAAELMAQGVGPEVRVAIHAERSCEYVLGILAVLKAGGAFIPLDPQLPSERLAYQLADSGARLMLSSTACDWNGDVPVMELAFADDIPAAVESESPVIHPQQTAYVIYTSGSTGKPKGVAVSHGALVNYVQSVLEALALPEGARNMAMVSTVAADLGHTVLFGALCTGRTLHLISPECAFDPDAFAAYMREQQVDVLKVVPSHLRALLSAATPADVLPHERLILGGEATDWALLERIAELKPTCRVLNHYGPTETTVGILTQQADMADRAASTLPIGTPLVNAQAYVLDPWLNPVPKGVAGELYLGGPGLAQGYLQRLGQTAERFVASPFHAGERLYRSGDRVRQLADGSLAFLGRVDDQVKIRGYRVEPSEIAALLRDQPGIAEAEVIARENEEGRAQLYAYVVMAAGSGVDDAELLTQLGERVPDYMVPSAMVRLDALPLTANGKLDRKALPEPVQTGGGKAFEAPQGEAEEALAAVWADVIGCEQVGRNDNFFELGGDSILSLQIVARSRKRGYKVTPKQLMEGQTVAAVAAMATPLAAAVPKQVVAPDKVAPFALLPVQRWFFEQNFAEPHHWNQSLMLEAASDVDAALLRRAIEAVVDHHGALRLRFERVGDSWQQAYGKLADDLFKHLDLSDHADPAQAITQAADAAQHSLSLERPFRAIWMALGGERGGRLLLVAHHLVVDGVSWRVILDDLQAAYAQLSAGKTVDLPPATTSLDEWARALADYAKSEALAEQCSYWEGLVKEPEPSLPARNPHGSNTVSDTASLVGSLPTEATTQLLGPVHKAYRTQVDDLLLTALSSALCQWAERDSVLIELEGHGREDLFDGVDLSRSVGWFTSLYPVRLTPGNAEPGTSLKAIKEQLRQVPEKGLGYGVLRYLKEELALVGGAYPQVTFNYLGQLDRSLQGDGAWRLAKENAGQARAPQSKRRTWIEVVAWVQDGQLRFDWNYSREIHSEAAIHALQVSFQAQLEALIEHCASGVRGATPSDFPLAGLSQGLLDGLRLDVANVEDIYPLAPMQQGLLLHTLLNPGAGMYMMQDRYRFASPIDVNAFEKAWQRVGERYEVLRTGFVWQTEEIQLQVVYRQIPSPVEYIDWRGIDEDEADRRLAVLLRQELDDGFDLERPPLLKVRLIQLAENLFYVVQSFHHILMDAWCRSLLLSDFFHYYDAYRLGTNYELTQPRPYRDFIAWLQQQDANVLRNYWQHELEGFDEITPIPYLKPHGSHDSVATVADVFSSLSHDESAELQNVARQHQLTVNTIVQGAWALLLGRLSQVDDILFGVTVAGRPLELEGIQETMGLFINTIPLRVSAPSPQTSVLDWLHALLGKNLEMRQYEHLPLVEIQSLGELSQGRSLFDSLFVFENAPIDASITEKIHDLHVSIKGNRTHTNYPLTVVVVPGEQLMLQLSYDTRKFDDSEVERLLSGFRQILLHIIDRPDAPYHELDVLPVNEMETQRAQCTGQSVAYPFERGYIDLFREQVRQHPRQVAVRHQGDTLTYDQLEDTSNRIAQALRQAGVKKDNVVALHAERGLALPSMILGTFKSGGAYLALDTRLPDQRIANMLASSHASVLVATAEQAPRLETVLASMPNPPRMLVFEDLVVSEGLEGDITVPVHPDQAAYVIYTSGSTGEPKGVVVSHRGMLNNQLSKVPYLDLSASDVIAQTAALSFDISVWQTLAGLLCGARIEIVPDEIARDPSALLPYVRDNGVTVLQSVPAVIQGMLNTTSVDLPALRWLLPTGEASTYELVRQWFTRYPAIPLVNAYGPAECADDVSLHLLRSDDDEHVAVVPIGKPADNTQLIVLDNQLNPLPTGVSGELYVAGVGVGRGYLNQPKLTSERFVPNPFADVPGERLYRTGDLARYRTDGALEYIGRTDQQVKIRGQRIELGEIESRLVEFDVIREAVVVAQEGPGGDRLVAYAVAQPHESINTAELRERLGQVVPDYMVPSVVVMLDALPLTPNGKVDRKALPEPDFASNAQYEPPQGETEETLATIWSEVLGVERVGRHDNFFELGGHSLLALSVLERMRVRGLESQVRTLFQSPELAAFAKALSLEPNRKQLVVPPNRIPEHCQSIQPDMLTLIDLDTNEISRIEDAVPGGAKNIQDIYPLAPLQEGILFHHRLQEEGDTYVLPCLLGFDSQERLEQFVAGFNQLIARHDILRTAVLWEGLHEPVQVVYRHASLELEWLEVEGTDTSCSVSELLNAHVDPEHYRIDVRQAPMVRAIAAQDAEQGRWLLQLPSHHLVLDHTTLDLLVDEIALIQQGREEELPKSLPFRNFVAQARLGVNPAEHEAFFRERLGDVDEPTAPFGLLDIRGDGSDIEEVRLPLEAELARQVRQQAQRHGVSTASLFHLAWALVLSKTTGRDDVVFGTLLFGRMQGTEGSAQALGMFINTLPVRIGLGANGVADCLRRTHDVLTELLHHEHASLALAQRCSSLPGGAPLFSTLLNYRYSTPQAKGTARRVWAGMEALGGKDRTNYPITMSVDDLGNGFQLVGQVSRIIGAQRLCDYLSAAIEGIVENLQAVPQQPISEISLLRTDEQLLLSGWGENTQQYSETVPIYQLIEQQAAEIPDAPALVFAGQSLSYAELNTRANRLAHYLVGLGVKPETRVGIAVERSIEMVVGLLGILKAGGAYVPLDPDYPSDRLAYMVEDSGIELLLTQQHLRESLRVAESLNVIELDQLDVSHHASTNPNVAMHGENLAYVIYTSGSTGRPKGAANRHYALTNRLEWMQGAYGLTTDDAVLQKTPFSFDVSVWEFFWPLMQGARLVMAPSGAHREPAQLVDLIRTHGITTLHFVPSMLQAFLVHGEVETCTSLTRLVCSGEALQAELQNQVLVRLPHTALYNLYGPTEAAIDVTHWTCQDDGRNHVAIGQPIVGIRTYVLDGDLNLAPPDVAGELYLGGIGLARGYLHRPDLTAERFIADPFAQGERLYRTGDLVRWREDGQLEYLGRLDHQVKIRGLRIELGEIEAELLAQPEVRESVVIAQESPGGSRLVAYVVPQADSELDTSSLREALGQRLPDYMVPSVVVTLEALPLNANGKVDRKALPEPDLASGSQYEPPQGEVEEVLAQIWSEVLGVERVGRHDNFFEMGGDSILTLQVVAKARDEGWKLSPKQLFEFPSVMALALVTSASQTFTDEEELDSEVPLLPIQSWFFDMSLSARHHWNQTVLLESREQLYIAPLKSALHALVAHHDALRLRYRQDTDGRWVQFYAPVTPETDGEVLWVRQAANAGEVEALCNQAQLSMDLAEGPLLRALAIEMADGSWRLLLTIHHLVVDGVSWRILLDDLQVAYTQANSCKNIKLPPKSSSYQRWANRLSNDVSSFSSELAHWQALAATPTELPCDHPQGERQLCHQESVQLTFDEKVTEALVKEAPKAYRTQINDLLLVALGRALCAWSGHERILIDLEGHGREDLYKDIDLSRTVGWFTSLYPVVLNPLGEHGAAIKRVKEMLRGIPSNGLGYGVLKYLGSEDESRVISALPQASIVFNYLGQLDGSFDKNSLWRPARESAGVAIDANGTATHDFTINGQIFDGELCMTLNYSTALYSRSTVDEFMDGWRAELEALVAHCLDTEAGGVTQSDLVGVDIGEVTLDDWLDEVL